MPHPEVHASKSFWRYLAGPSVALALFLGCDTGPWSAVEYPETPRVEHTDTYHGVDVEDPYRWLEELDSDETAQWVQAQNDISVPLLSNLPKHQEITERLTSIWNYERYGTPFKEGGRYFYTRNNGLQDQSVLYTADRLEQEPTTLLDPNTFSDDATVSLAGYSVSPDGQHIAYAKSDGGSDWRSWNIRNIDTGEDLPETLNFTKFTPVSWSPDGSGFYYSRHPAKADGTGDGTAAVSLYHHTLGEDQSDDEMVYSIPEHPRRNPMGGVTEDGRFLVINVSEGFDANAVYYRDLRRRNAGVVKLLDAWDALYNFLGNDGSTFYFQTNKDAPKWRVIAIDLDRPSPANWREVIPEAEEALGSVSYVGGHFVTSYLKDAHTLAKVYSTAGEHVRDVDLPGVGSANGFGGHADDPETFFSYTGFTSPGTVYRYNVATGEAEEYKQSHVDADLDQFETEQVFFASKDGTQVPMFITHRKGMALDGTNPTLLYAYGGFNISLTPRFSAERIVWLEMGGVLAVPNLRGGGEYGEEWHEAGTKLNKQNVFDDFIAAAEWLIDNGYTSTPKLAIQGGSNGGLLVGAVLTQRPDLYGAALPAVGVLDMLRYHTPSLNARGWSSDYGTSEDEEEFKALLAYSPLHNVEEGTCYPPTLISTADHDDRVVPWHSFKFGATMQRGQSCSNPILVRVETRAGHGAGKPTWMRIEEVADQWAFLAAALSIDD
jgi:prolyl oligopeptidase